MRLAIIGVVTVAAGLATDMQVASAQWESSQRRYCGRSGLSHYEFNCAYDTLEQCKRGSFESTRTCTENPFWHRSRQTPPAPRPGQPRIPP
jgi:hypothetical protein